MYLPRHFREDDREVLDAFIEAHPLGLLITAGSAGVIANPVPFILVKRAAEGDVLRAHLARPNLQLDEIRAGAACLVTFFGLDHYISPSWYPSKAKTHQVVPTWNYQMVQVRGAARVDESEAFLREQIEALTWRHEQAQEQPWQVSDAPERFIGAQMRGIAGIEIAMEAVIGKFKLSQNRSEEDHAGVMARLDAIEDAAAQGMADAMQANSGQRGKA
jgi:transcriptional regulator